MPQHDMSTEELLAHAQVSREMPRYKSHKQVWALKIAAIAFDADEAQKTNRETDGSATITPAEEGYAPFKVDRHYVNKHDPQVGGYYVVYADGYKSWSPAAAFEEGNTLILPASLTVGFKVDLRPSGDVNRVQLSKDGVSIGLTLEQAKSLVRELEARLQ